MWETFSPQRKNKSKVHPKAARGQCCFVDYAMWDNMEAKVSKLATSMNEMKELLFMNIGLGSNSRSVMFTATIVEGAHRVPLGGPNIKDIVVTLVLGLVDINPIPPTLMWDYKSIGSKLSVKDLDTTMLDQLNTGH
jgi:hypothetical protein